MIFFVNPHLITEVGDPHTGIPIMPVMMAYAYSSAKKNNIENISIGIRDNEANN